MDSEKVTQTFNGLATWEIPGAYFKLMSTVSPVSLTLRKGGRVVHQAAAVEGGHYQRIAFDKVEITTIALEAVSWLYAPDQGGSDRFTGSFSLTGYAPGQTYTQAKFTAGVASAVMLAPNAVRRYLAVQNPDGVKTAWIRTAAAAAVADATCFKLLPGQTWEPPVPPLGEIRVISDTAAHDLQVIEA